MKPCPTIVLVPPPHVLVIAEGVNTWLDCVSLIVASLNEATGKGLVVLLLSLTGKVLFWPLATLAVAKVLLTESGERTVSVALSLAAGLMPCRLLNELVRIVLV